MDIGDMDPAMDMAMDMATVTQVRMANTATSRRTGHKYKATSVGERSSNWISSNVLFFLEEQVKSPNHRAISATNNNPKRSKKLEKKKGLEEKKGFKVSCAFESAVNMSLFHSTPKHYLYIVKEGQDVVDKPVGTQFRIVSFNCEGSSIVCVLDVFAPPIR